MRIVIDLPEGYSGLDAEDFLMHVQRDLVYAWLSEQDRLEDAMIFNLYQSAHLLQEAQAAGLKITIEQEGEPIENPNPREAH